MKRFLLTNIIMLFALAIYAQTVPCAYIIDNSGTPTNVRNAPNGKVVQKIPLTDGGYVVVLLEVKNKWWKIAPSIDIYGEEDDATLELKGSHTGYWIHYSVLQFGIAGDPENVLRTTPSEKGKPLQLETSLLFDGLHPLEIRGEWIKVETNDKRHTGWMPIDRICSNPLTTCP